MELLTFFGIDPVKLLLKFIGEVFGWVNGAISGALFDKPTPAFPEFPNPF